MGLFLSEFSRHVGPPAFPDSRTTLAAEYLSAARTDPHRAIGTPGFADGAGGRPTMPLIDVMSDQLAGIGASADWAELIQALASCPRGVSFLRRMADEHAAFHADAEVA